MPKQTETEQARENQFTEEIAPLIDKVTELCEKYDMPLLVAVQLYVNSHDGARIAAQSVETKSSVLPLKISSKLLRGEAQVTLDSDTSFYITLADEQGNYEEQFDADQLETLGEHAKHCEDCRVHMETRLAEGEDISNIRIMGDHSSHGMDSYGNDDEMDFGDIKNPLGLIGGFLSKKSRIVH